MVSVNRVEEAAREQIGDSQKLRRLFRNYRSRVESLQNPDQRLTQAMGERRAEQLEEEGDKLVAYLEKHGMNDAALAIRDHMGDTFSDLFSTDPYGEFGRL